MGICNRTFQPTPPRRQRGNMEGLSENLEDYLETILELQRENTVARVKDIASKLGILSGSVTSALRTLSARGLINYKPYSFITLTPEGEKIAEEILRRHSVIKDFSTTFYFPNFIA